MNRTDLERLINLGVSLDRDEAARSTEYQALSASLRAEEEERERSKPENIRAEIQQCLEHACCRYLPGWFDQLRMRVTYCNDHWSEPHAASWTADPSNLQTDRAFPVPNLQVPTASRASDFHGTQPNLEKHCMSLCYLQESKHLTQPMAFCAP